MIVGVVVMVEYKDSRVTLHSLYPLQVQVQGVAAYRDGKLITENFEVWVECLEAAVMRSIAKKFEDREYKVLEWSLGDT
jgi:hypothetical protein